MKARYIAALAMLAGCAIGAAAIQSIQAQTKPQPVTYYIAEVEVTNLDGYLRDYVPRMEANVKAFGGRVLAETTRVATIEGDPPRPRVILQYWDGIEKFQTWRNAPESREIRAIGHKYAKFRSFIVEGYPP